MGKAVLIPILCIVAAGLPAADAARGADKSTEDRIQGLLEESLAGFDLASLIPSPVMADMDLDPLGTYDVYVQNPTWEPPVVTVQPVGDAYAASIVYSNFTSGLNLERTCSWNASNPLNCIGPGSVTGTLSIGSIVFEADVVRGNDRLEIDPGSVSTTTHDVFVDLPAEFAPVAGAIVSFFIPEFTDSFEAAMIDVLDQVLATGISGIEHVPGAPLLSNHPNPFNPRTTIAFVLPRQGAVTLRVFDVGGFMVKTLIDGEVYDQGRQEVVWRGTDDSGRQCSSGTYFYRLEAGRFSETKTMVLVK